ncbi:major histocompatibility complex class I-related protein 1-like isoform X2 [Brachyhypopomus gauderio]|uniref:major histocompatibility complex class I-related protein 1-like isoform X2 n=1 Tax=Brachyhypopomus gauderio TaxID=698409 RepID=UPI0040438FC4
MVRDGGRGEESSRVGAATLKDRPPMVLNLNLGTTRSPVSDDRLWGILHYLANCIIFCWYMPFRGLTTINGFVFFPQKNTLYYIYTALSKPHSLPGVYEFTAMGLLDDREIDYFNSQNQEKVPMQDWMKEKMQADYWVKGTDSRRSKQQWFKVNVDILMERMRHNKSDLHVLQWRHGCEVEDIGGVTFLKGMDLYSYDGEDFLSFDSSRSQWIAPVRVAEATKKKWDDVPILNQYTKGYLEKECVDWLTRFMEYGRESLRNHSKPDVYAFAKKCVSDSSKLTLTCLATGFYPKDVKMSVRKYRTSLPENMLMSLGVRPNDDETYQLRKSVVILENEQADYDCYVDHISLKEPVISKWAGARRRERSLKGFESVSLISCMVLVEQPTSHS